MPGDARETAMPDGVSRRTVVGFAMAVAAASTARATDSTERREVARRLAEVVRREYQDPASAESMADAIGARLSGGAYDTALTDDAFAATLTADLRAVTPDPHMAVMANLDAGAPRLSADPVYSLRQNYGVQGVRRLGGNVGVIELNFAPNLGFADAILERYAAAMALVRDTRALIVDLRAHIGGEPGTVAYFVSYFFERAPFVVNRIRYRNKPTVDHTPSPFREAPSTARSVPSSCSRPPAPSRPAKSLPTTFKRRDGLASSVAEPGAVPIPTRHSTSGADSVPSSPSARR